MSHKAVWVVVNPQHLTSGGDARISARIVDDGAGAAPDAVPTITIARVVDGVWTVDVDHVDMLSANTDTAVVDGPDYYHDAAYTQGAEHHILIEGALDGVKIHAQESVRADPVFPAHIHNGIDSPRIWWEHLLGVPDNVQGANADFTPHIIEQTDEPARNAHGLREVAVRDRGVGDLDQQAAGQLLGDHKEPEQIVEFEVELSKEPRPGMPILVHGRLHPYVISRVRDLGDGWWHIEAGARRVGGQSKDDHRLSKVERY